MGHKPLFHVTVGLAGVVDEPTDVTHSVAINHHASVEVQAVVVLITTILLHHPPPELSLTHHLSTVLYYELACGGIECRMKMGVLGHSMVWCEEGVVV